MLALVTLSLSKSLRKHEYKHWQQAAPHASTSSAGPRTDTVGIISNKHDEVHILYILLVTVPSFAQNFEWAVQGGTSNAYLVKKDRQNNVYVSAGPYIEKYSASGVFIWQQLIPMVKGFVVDSIGNIYATGAFGDTIVISGITLVSTAGGNSNMYLAKYDSSGNFQWVSRSLSNQDSGTDDISLDANGNPIIIGRFKDSLQLDSYVFDAPSTNQVYLAKYSITGSCIWAKHLKASTFSGGTIGPKIRTDKNGDSYIAGHYIEWASFDSLNIIANGGYLKDIFLTKFDINGDFLWAKTMGGTTSETFGTFDVDSLGNSYISGDFGGTEMYFDSYTLAGTSGYDAFTAKYDADGNFQWANLEYTQPIAAANDGYYTSNNNTLLKHDSTGTLQWTKSATGAVSMNAILADGEDVYIAGGFTGTAGFDAFTLSASSSSMFLAKLSSAPLATEINHPQEISFLSAYPNPTNGTLRFEYRNNAAGNIRVSLMNSTGQLQLDKRYETSGAELADELDLSGCAKGVYFLRISNAERTEMRKIVLQ